MAGCSVKLKVTKRNETTASHIFFWYAHMVKKKYAKLIFFDMPILKNYAKPRKTIVKRLVLQLPPRKPRITAANPPFLPALLPVRNLNF